MKTLFTIDAEALMSTPLPSLRFVVDKLLPQGLHILAGAPKIGKSWLALYICLCVARGDPLWEFPSTKGTVLYLCLEDSYARIQQRLFELTAPVIDDAPPADLALNSLSVFLTGVSPFDGTATELSELLELHTGEKILPSILSKRLARYASELDKAGIQITTSRTRDARTLHISARPSDGNDGKNDMASV